MITKLVIIAEPKTVHFNLSKKVGNNLKQEIYFIIKHNEILAEHTIKTRLVDYCPNISMKMIFINTENSEKYEPRKFFLTCPRD